MYVYVPLPGDQIDVVSQGGVVLGQLFGWGVFTGVLRFGGVGIRQCSQAHQHTQHHGHQHRPWLQHHGHLKQGSNRRGVMEAEGPKIWVNPNRKIRMSSLDFVILFLLRVDCCNSVVLFSSVLLAEVIK